MFKVGSTIWTVSDENLFQKSVLTELNVDGSTKWEKTGPIYKKISAKEARSNPNSINLYEVFGQPDKNLWIAPVE